MGVLEIAKGMGVTLGKLFQKPVTVSYPEERATMLATLAAGMQPGDTLLLGTDLVKDRSRLVAAYDHRHVFIDPDPDPDVGFAERKRLFDLAGSSWNDYDRAKISAYAAAVIFEHGGDSRYVSGARVRCHQPLDQLLADERSGYLWLGHPRQWRAH